MNEQTEDTLPNRELTSNEAIPPTIVLAHHGENSYASINLLRGCLKDLLDNTTGKLTLILEVSNAKPEKIEQWHQLVNEGNNPSEAWRLLIVHPKHANRSREFRLSKGQKRLDYCERNGIAGNYMTKQIDAVASLNANDRINITFEDHGDAHPEILSLDKASEALHNQAAHSLKNLELDQAITDYKQYLRVRASFQELREAAMKRQAVDAYAGGAQAVVIAIGSFHAGMLTPDAKSGYNPGKVYINDDFRIAESAVVQAKRITSLGVVPSDQLCLRALVESELSYDFKNMQYTLLDGVPLDIPDRSPIITYLDNYEGDLLRSAIENMGWSQFVKDFLQEQFSGFNIPIFTSSNV